MISLLNILAQSMAYIFGVVSIFIITFGFFRTFYTFIKQCLYKHVKFDHIRLEFSLYLILALEFLVAKDVVESIIDQSWEGLGKLGVIILIRVLLSHFILNDIEKLEYDSALHGLVHKRKKRRVLF